MTIQRYDSKTQEPKKPLSYKVRRIIEGKCLVPGPKGSWICRPIPGYNTTTYHLRFDYNMGWTCDCQGFATKRKKGLNPTCSHIQALKAYLEWQNEELWDWKKSFLSGSD